MFISSDAAVVCSYSMAQRALCTTMKTYGPRPPSFKLPDGEEYMFGSAVGNYLRLFRGSLYKKFPNLTKRSLQPSERDLLTREGHNPALVSSNVWIVKASEVDDILSGNEEKYRVSGSVATLDTSYSMSVCVAW